MKLPFDKKLIKSFSIYAGSNLLNSAIPFLLLPFLTEYLNPEEYGIVSMFQLLIYITIPFAGLLCNSAIERAYFDKEEKKDIPRYVFNSLIIIIVSSIFVLFIFIFAGNFIAKLSEFPRKWLFGVLIYVVFFNISGVLLSLWRVKKKEILYGVFRILRTLLDVGLSIYFVLMLRYTWEGRIMGQIIPFVAFGIITIYILIKNKWLKFEYNAADIKDIIRYGAPLVAHNLGSIIIGYSDRLFVVNEFGLSVMGLYSVGYQVGMIIYLVQNSFNLAWVPWFFEKLNLNDININKKIVIFTYFYFIVMILLVFLLILINPIIFSILGENYTNAQQFVFYIALGFAFNGMYKMVVNYLFYLKKTKLVGIVTLITAGLNILLNIVLIKYNGAIGAAQATCIAFLLQFVFIFYISAKNYNMPWLLGILKKK